MKSLFIFFLAYLNTHQAQTDEGDGGIEKIDKIMEDTMISYQKDLRLISDLDSYLVEKQRERTFRDELLKSSLLVEYYNPNWALSGCSLGEIPLVGNWRTKLAWKIFDCPKATLYEMDGLFWDFFERPSTSQPLRKCYRYSNATHKFFEDYHEKTQKHTENMRRLYASARRWLPEPHEFKGHSFGPEIPETQEPGFWNFPKLEPGFWNFPGLGSGLPSFEKSRLVSLNVSQVSWNWRDCRKGSCSFLSKESVSFPYK